MLFIINNDMSSTADVKKLAETYKAIVTECWNSPATDNNISPVLIKTPETAKKEEDCEGNVSQPAVANNGETDAYMAKNELFKIQKYAKELHDMIQDSENLEPWLFSKITLAGNYIDSVKHYLEYEKFRKEEDAAEHGSNVVAKLRSMLQGESKEVLEQAMRQIIFNLEALQTIEETKK